MPKCHNDAPACHYNILIGVRESWTAPTVKPRQVLVVLLPVLDGHQLLPGPVIEATAVVALAGERPEPHLAAAVAGAGHHTAFLVPLDVFNHTAI